MTCLEVFSNWVEYNSGQIQIVIGIFAFFVAVIALIKILEQIKISNNQTQLSINQIDSLNKERLFDLRLRLTIRIGEQFKILRNLQDETNAVSQKLQIFLIEIKNNHENSLNGLSGIADFHREQITNYFELMNTKFKETHELQKSLDKKIDINFIENVLEEVEKNQIIYNSMWDGIIAIEKNINDIWLPLKTGDVMQAAKIKHNLN
ncbi:hypothetical protein G9F32_03040 [Acinetobacter sp. 194]|uniref:hypothetical protein n=1 Tax=Acinetobacter shaoyimingii TaxID=2715164 RepID=UPI00140A8EDD|nr:hypothetical protein [Acinetobacter shaoyimingii]NHB57009.1 hypothetical protein [Acinetobacter shaoyimingii]